jgi:hypothetical protein
MNDPDTIAGPVALPTRSPDATAPMPRMTVKLPTWSGGGNTATTTHAATVSAEATGPAAERADNAGIPALWRSMSEGYAKQAAFAQNKQPSRLLHGLRLTPVHRYSFQFHAGLGSGLGGCYNEGGTRTQGSRQFIATPSNSMPGSDPA